MTSKEALELLELILLNHSSMLVINDKRFEYFNIIKERLEMFEKEIQELKELQELNKQGLWNLKQENEKLKKAIEIFKTFVSVSSEVNFDTFITSYCDDDLFDLLKLIGGIEVINNE